MGMIKAIREGINHGLPVEVKTSVRVLNEITSKTTRVSRARGGSCLLTTSRTTTLHKTDVRPEEFIELVRELLDDE